MENVLSLPGRGNTYFYFSRMGKDGFSKEQQTYIRDLIAAYRKRFSRLEITAVWDFGMEEGTRYENEKYGVFADCRDLAVSNRDMASISYNQIRVSRMPMDIPAHQLREILEGFPDAEAGVTAVSGLLAVRLLSSGNETVTGALRALWTGLRPLILGKEPVPPRVWAT